MIDVDERGHRLRSESPLTFDGRQPSEDQNEQQQQQLANHSSHNAEIARCLSSFCHPG